ncbi:MAG TPA: ATP-binding cassette domain-containing protein [Desulfomonilia bacterium]
MRLLTVNNVSIRFGGPLILDCADLNIETGERIGLVGRNGSGKSTLMKLIAGEIMPDEGGIIKNGDIRTSLLPQEVPDNLSGSVYDVVASGGMEHIELLREYHDLTARIASNSSESDIRKLERVQHLLETTGAWHHHLNVETVITNTGLDENAEFKTLSAGMKRRVFLARALVKEPDILLLDEPTNHLDISSIEWLEAFLRDYGKTVMFVSHDREFLRRLSNRIVEIDRGRLISLTCGYDAYAERREAMLAEEERHRQEFDKKLAREEVWIRRGVEARRTRNEGRVRALMQMRELRAQRRDSTGSAKINIQQAEASGRLIVDAKDITFGYSDTPIIKDFSTTIIRGDKVGIIGPNGSGKTTLLKILLGGLVPQTGDIRIGTRIKIAYFDQLRAQIDDDKTLMENIADKNDMVFLDGSPRHVMGYLQSFLFTKDQIVSPAKKLSGGERNRLLLAKLFSTPSNVLVMDEPTNDLDADTLEMLEDRLVEYGGTVLLVSHDRAFLNNVVTSTIALEGNGRLQEYVGGYDDYIRQRSPVMPEPVQKKKEMPKKEARPKEKTKLSFKESRELAELPVRIESLEEEKRGLTEKLNDASFQMNSAAKTINDAIARLEAVDAELDALYARWEELEDLAMMLNQS